MAPLIRARPATWFLVGIAAGAFALSAPSAKGEVSSLDLDRDGLRDGLERRIGLTPGRSDRIEFVDAGSKGGRCSDGRRLAKSARGPWCSLARAAQEAPAGATVLVRRGAYAEGTLDRTRGGPVRLLPYPGERVVLRGLAISGRRVRLERFRITARVNLLRGARRVALVGNRFTTRSTAVNLEAGVRDVLVAGNRIAQRRGVGTANAINFSSTDATPAIVDVTIRDNRIGPVTSGGDAIQAKHTRRLLIEDNEIFGVRRPPGSAAHPDALQSIFGAQDLTLKGNFIHDIAAQGLFIQGFRGENRNLRAEDNVIARIAYPWVPFAFTSQGAKITHNTVTGMLRTGETARGAVLVGNIVGTLVIPEGAPAVRERRNLARRFTRRRGRGSLRGRPRFKNARRNDFRLARRSRGRRRGTRGIDLGARKADWRRAAFQR